MESGIQPTGPAARARAARVGLRNATSQTGKGTNWRAHQPAKAAIRSVVQRSAGAWWRWSDNSHSATAASAMTSTDQSHWRGQTPPFKTIPVASAAVSDARTSQRTESPYQNAAERPARRGAAGGLWTRTGLAGAHS